MQQHYRNNRPKNQSYYTRRPGYRPNNNRPNHPYKPYRPYRRKQRPVGAGETIILVGLLIVALVAWAYQGAGADAMADQILAAVAAVGILAILAAAFYLLRMQQKSRALRALKWSNVDVMDGFTFEQYIGAVMKSQGYEVAFTAASGDFGVDILAKKDDKRIAVQIKRSRNFIGLGAVQEVVAGMYHYKCDQSMVVTNSTFSPAAKTLAASNNCRLIDRGALGQWIFAFQTGKLL